MTSKAEYAVIAFEKAAKTAHNLVDRVWDRHLLHCHHIDGLRESLEMSVQRLYARLDEMIVKGYSEQVEDIEQVRDVLDHMLAGVVLPRWARPAGARIPRSTGPFQPETWRV